MMYLPDLTLVIVDTVNPALAEASLIDTLSQICPSEILCFTSERLLTAKNAQWFKTRASSYDDVAEVLWHEVPWHIRTSHYLIVQWDSWVLDGMLWNNKWLTYDYIGAPWGWHSDGLNVGNGGFSLRSRQLGRFIGETQRFVPKHPEDDTLCREYRKELESFGFLWADLDTARSFAFEREAPVRSTFGFHGIFNWPRVLTQERLARRMCMATEYVRKKPEWSEMLSCVSLV